MRSRSGCEACRARHRKCVFPTGGNACYGCLEKGKDCLPPAKFIFISPDENSSSDVRPPPAICTSSDVGPSFSVIGSASATSPALEHALRGSFGPSTVSPSSSLALIRPLISLNQREGQLFALYVRQLAPMMDSCDEARHFTLTIPRLALHEPMLLSSILALAGRYDALHRSTPPDLDAVRYNSQSIESLIERLACPPETYGPELLAAVVIARSYEECDFEDDRSHHHLSGISNLLSYDTVVRLASEGGLAEAACWVHLRQAVYAYLVRRRPVDSHFDAFRRLPAFTRSDDAAYANRMVYYFARVLKLFLPHVEPSVPISEMNTWEYVQAEIGKWFDEKPPSFEAICFAESGENGDHPYPQALMLGAAPVMGLQYYYAAMIVFRMKECNSASLGVGFEAVRARNRHETSIISNLFILMGLATSNEHVLDAFLLPTHMLSLCGYCIKDPWKRGAVLEFLRKVKALVAWTTSSLIRALTKQWAEYDSMYGVT